MNYKNILSFYYTRKYTYTYIRKYTYTYIRIYTHAYPYVWKILNIKPHVKIMCVTYIY